MNNFVIVLSDVDLNDSLLQEMAAERPQLHSETIVLSKTHSVTKLCIEENVETATIPLGTHTIIWATGNGVHLKVDQNEFDLEEGKILTLEDTRLIKISHITKGSKLHFLILEVGNNFDLFSYVGLWPGYFKYSEKYDSAFLELEESIKNNAPKESVNIMIYSFLNFISEDIVRSSHCKLSHSICKHIHMNWRDTNLNVASVIEEFRVGRTKASQFFKNYKGMTIKEYIEVVRLNNAKKILGDTTQSIRDVSVYCGYSDAGYFASRFKNFFNVSPSEYQDSLGI